MVITVTMNPAIDKTAEVEKLITGGLNRIKRVEYDAGGKGINVSKTIGELGGESIATGFLGGNAGAVIEKVLKERNIQTDFVWVKGETRTNTKVLEENGMVTEINEPGPVVSEAEMKELLCKLDQYAGEGSLFVLAGSVPSGVEKDIYRRMIERIHQKKAKVLLDADGELFRQALPAVPDMIKPNRSELEEYAGIDYRAAEETLLETARGLLEKGMETVAVSMGKQGAMFLKKDYQVRCPGLKVKAHSTVGAGDAMVAAMAYAWDAGLDKEETVRTCMAASAGAVTTVGTKPPSKELVESLKPEVVIEVIEK